jgi:hypothetical protein
MIKQSTSFVFTNILVLAVLMFGGIHLSCNSLSTTTNISSQQQSKNESTTSDVPMVEVCEVLRNSHSYQSKVIRINGNLGRFRDYVTFYDERCVPPHPLISVEFASPSKSDSGNGTGDKLDQIIRGSEEAREGNIHVLVSAVGLFEAIPRSELKDYSELRYRFTVRSIEEMK